jgi:hypothetical protein
MDNGNQAMVHEQQEPIEAQDVAADAAEGLSEEEAAIVGFFRNCHGASRPCVQVSITPVVLTAKHQSVVLSLSFSFMSYSATLSRFKSINHVLRETYSPLQWRITTKEYTGSLASRQKVTAQLALVAQINSLLEANGTDATRKPCAITTKQVVIISIIALLVCNNMINSILNFFYRLTSTCG